MSDATYYNWKSKYSGMTVSDLKKLKTLEEENRRLKQIVAEQALDIRALKDLLILLPTGLSPEDVQSLGDY
jgi:putative transposase